MLLYKMVTRSIEERSAAASATRSVIAWRVRFYIAVLRLCLYLILHGMLHFMFLVRADGVRTRLIIKRGPRSFRSWLKQRLADPCPYKIAVLLNMVGSGLQA